jgi:OmpA-OmpF porin, OOP family
MHGPTYRAAIASVLLITGGSAHALDSGFYVGASIGQSDYDLEVRVEAPPTGEQTFSADIDSKDIAYGLFGGYQFGRWFAIEGALNSFGKGSVDHSYFYRDSAGTLESNGTSEVESRAVSLAGLLTIPLGQSFSIGLRAGVAYSDLDHDGEGAVRIDGQGEFVRTRDSETNIAPVFGANVEYAISPRMSLRADWQRFNDVGEGIGRGIDGLDIDVLNLSVTWRF